MGGSGKKVRAAGGVVVRDLPGGPYIAIVHRPRYDDWSLPKGKLARGERFKDGAVREVAEETGITCELGPELPRSRHTARKGRSKVVRWWLMTPKEPIGEFVPNDEVDELRWCTEAEARELLDYPSDRELVAAALATPR